MATKVETVTVVCTDQEGNSQTIVIPAYTQSYNRIKAEIGTLAEDYLERSIRTRNPMSMGDFALYALARAERDPHTL